MTCLSRLDRTVSFFSLKCTIHDTLRVHLSLKFYVHMSNPSSFFIFRPKITYSIVIILMVFLCNTLKSSILEWDSNLKFSFYFDIIVYPLKICFNSLSKAKKSYFQNVGTCLSTCSCPLSSLI